MLEKEFYPLEIAVNGVPDIVTNIDLFEKHVDKTLDGMNVEVIETDIDYDEAREKISMLNNVRKLIKDEAKKLDTGEIANVRDVLLSIDKKIMDKTKTFKDAVSSKKKEVIEWFKSEAYKTIIKHEDYTVNENVFNAQCDGLFKGRSSLKIMNELARAHADAKSEQIKIKIERLGVIEDFMAEFYDAQGISKDEEWIKLQSMGFVENEKQDDDIVLWMKNDIYEEKVRLEKKKQKQEEFKKAAEEAEQIKKQDEVIKQMDIEDVVKKDPSPANVLWFNNFKSSFGIVMKKDEYTGEAKAYISQVSGLDPKEDMKYILENGVKIFKHDIEKLYNFFN